MAIRTNPSIRLARPLTWGVAVTACWALFTVGCAEQAQLGPGPYPSSVYAPLPAGPPRHVVRPKETLWSIGRAYGVAYQDIMRVNGLTDAGRLQVGQALLIPRVAPVPPSIPLYPTRRWTHLVIHHSATAQGSARTIDRAHRERGFSGGLGYHFVIDNGTLGRRDGQIEIGHRWLRQMNGAHCNRGGMNEHGIGLCLVGNFTRRPISSSQMQSLVYLVDELRRYYGIPLSRVIRHRDVIGKVTECPGDSFPWGEFRQRLASSAQLR